MEAIRSFFGTFDIWQVLSSFVFLIAIIDPFGNIPITIAMQKKGVKIYPLNVCVASLVIEEVAEVAAAEAPAAEEAKAE